MSQQCLHLKFTWKSSNQKRWTFWRETINLCSCAGRTKSLEKYSHYPLLCTQRLTTSDENLNTTLPKKRRSRDPDPDVEARQDFWRIMRDYTYRNHVTPWTKLFVPRHDFPIHLNYIDVQRQTKTRLGTLHETVIDDYFSFYLFLYLSTTFYLFLLFLLFFRFFSFYFCFLFLRLFTSFYSAFSFYLCLPFLFSLFLFYLFIPLLTSFYFYLFLHTSFYFFLPLRTSLYLFVPLFTSFYLFVPTALHHRKCNQNTCRTQ